MEILITGVRFRKTSKYFPEYNLSAKLLTNLPLLLGTWIWLTTFDPSCASKTWWEENVLNRVESPCTRSRIAPSLCVKLCRKIPFTVCPFFNNTLPSFQSCEKDVKENRRRIWTAVCLFTTDIPGIMSNNLYVSMRKLKQTSTNCLLSTFRRFY